MVSVLAVRTHRANITRFPIHHRNSSNQLFMTSARPIITLITDFGLQDVYVGIMKGIIAQVNSTATLIDLNHQIPPQDVGAASFNLLNAYPYFPKGTVHIVVVDPGVGTRRRAVALEIAEGFLVGPDNGVFSQVLNQSPMIRGVELNNPQYWRSSSPSATFHGRDIFASVGAYLAGQIPMEKLGQWIEPESVVIQNNPGCREIRSQTGQLMTVLGEIQYIDRFGNAITNIPGRYITAPKHEGHWHDGSSSGWSLSFRNIIIPGYRTYSDGKPSEPLALVGSHGWIEIAVNGGHAQYQLRLSCGDEVKIQFALK